MATVVASKAQARLTIDTEVKAANKRQPGLNTSTGDFDRLDMTSGISLGKTQTAETRGHLV